MINETLYKRPITRDNIEQYASWCNGIIVNNSIAYKDFQGVIRTAKLGNYMYQKPNGSFTHQSLG